MENNSSYSRTFRIKQHTPLLHFHQPGFTSLPRNYRNQEKLPEIQEGATLRATELKPKLDKFLLGLSSLTVKDKWKLKKQERALDYKVRIIPEGTIETRFVNNNNSPMFFANMGRDAKHKVLSFTDHPIKVEFFSFHRDLLDIIDVQFADFLFQNNFGTRQSKGYGSFMVTTFDLNFLQKGYLQLDQRGNPNQISTQTYVMAVINYYYQRLKSGVNIGKHCIYRESFLKKYIYSHPELGYTWEKKWIKEEIIREIRGQDPDGNIPKFARAFLGLNESFTYMDQRMAERNRCNNVPNNKRFYPRNEVVIKFEHKAPNKNQRISRFQSPITFKPIFDGNNWRVYTHIHEIDPMMKNKEFIFKFPRSIKGLKTPENVINLNDLMDQYHKELGDQFEAFSYGGSLGWVKIINP